MATVIVYRSKSASFAARRVAKAVPGITAVQQDSYKHTNGNMLVRWDCFMPLPGGVTDLNQAADVVVSRDKATSRRLLKELAPPTWFEKADIQLPAVIRPRRHKAGKKFYVCRAPAAALRAVKLCGKGWYASQLIEKAREFRIFVVEGRVAAVSERFPGKPDAIAWNLALGGRLINVARKEWLVEVLRVSLEAMRRLGLGWGAVDACLDTAGHAWVFEVNTSPALRNKFTIRQIAKGLAHLSEIPAVKDGAKKPKSYAHPAVLKAGE